MHIIQYSVHGISMSHQKLAPYNFFKGHPSTDLLPMREILQASQCVIRSFTKTMAHYDGRENTHPMNYGPDLGNLEVRSLVAQWNDRLFKAKAPTDPNCINLTNGASFGLANAILQCTYPFNDITKRIFVISPTYFLVNSCFIDNGYSGKLKAIPEFDNGEIDIDSLVTELEQIEKVTPSKPITAEDIPKTQQPGKPMKKIYNYVLYVVPTFSNPKGGSLSLETKLRLINIARKFNMLIICDDVYELLDFKAGTDGFEYHKRMVYLDRETLPEGEIYGNVISNATFSKIVGPGLRVGWQETATPHLALALASGGAVLSGGTPSHLNTVIVGELLRNGEIDNIVSNFVHVYRERASALKRAVLRYLPRGTKISPVDGGYFSWVTLPPEYDNLKIAQECAKRGVILATGDNFEVSGDSLEWGKHGVRLSVSYMSSQDIDEGINIWGDVCKEVGRA